MQRMHQLTFQQMGKFNAHEAEHAEMFVQAYAAETYDHHAVFGAASRAIAMFKR